MFNTLQAKFKSNPLQSIVLSSVLIFHLIFVIIMLTAPSSIQNKKKIKSIIVRTVAAKPLQKTAAVEKKIIATAQTSPQQKKQTPVQPEVKKSEPPKEQVKKETAKPPVPAPAPVQKQAPKPAVKKDPAIADKVLDKSKQPAPQKSPPVENRAKISDSLLKELEESIAKIENKSDKQIISNKAPSVPKAARQIVLQIDQDTGADNTAGDYTDALISHLHRSLSLPEYGEVKIQLSLRQDGTVAKVIVLKTQNEKNRIYLESNLLNLRFPRFEGALANKKEYTFVLTFCNEL